MSESAALRLRLLLFAASMLVLAPAAVVVAWHMPAFGAHPLPYGEAVNRIAPGARNVTNMVTAVNFDLRGFDTLGEEFMLVAAVTGTMVLLRGGRGEASDRPGQAPGRTLPARSEAQALLVRWLAPLTVLFGVYVVLHAALTPGGGFQGGVIIASGVLLVYLGEGYAGWRHLVRSPLLHALEGGGAGWFALCGLAPLFAGAVFLENRLPMGPPRSILSGGLIPLVNAGVGFAVIGGFLMLFLEFLEETRAPEEPQETGSS